MSNPNLSRKLEVRKPHGVLLREVITSSGSTWAARRWSALVYDLANTRLAIMGGYTNGGRVNDFYTADVTPLFAVRFSYLCSSRHLETFFLIN